MLEAALAGLFGLLIGSFLNVCVFRMPRDLSVARPRSYCPVCKKTIIWRDNIPLLSYMLLEGQCRWCGQRIPARYPIVEALTAALFFIFTAKLGLTLLAFKYCLFSALMVGLLFSDLEARILPDEFTLGGALAGLALSWAAPMPDWFAAFFGSLAGFPGQGRAASLLAAFVSALIPSGFLWLTGELFRRVRHKEGLGFGDVKMVATIGAFLGLRFTLLTLIAGSLLGSVGGLVYIFIKKKDYSSYELPFGSFLALAAIGASLASLGANV